ncbi:MAG: sel1 repeat family protein, partial [Treponema sp.]|nr:sel1 repeat family protein [Treponema sp.]
QKALYWLEKAGEQNHDEALSLLGQIYLQKTWVPRDFTKAAEYLTKASDLGNAYARYKLAQMYENGTGIEANKEKAMELYQLAADGGVEEAADYLRFLKRR